jgi:dephospho-CoA kinase
MSGTGKSSVIQALSEQGYSDLLAIEDAEVLFVSACVPNQSRFYARFDQVVLLSASPELTAQRLAARIKQRLWQVG